MNFQILSAKPILFRAERESEDHGFTRGNLFSRRQLIVNIIS